MKRKIFFVIIFFIGGVVNSFSDDNPLTFLDFSKELKIDSVKIDLKEKGYSYYEEKPSVHGTDIYGNYSIECYGNGYNLSILHTPKSKIVFSSKIRREIPKKNFLQEALNLYTIIKMKYGAPISGALLNGDYFYADTDEEHKEKIDTDKIEIDSAYLVSCIESKQPVEYYWKVNDTRISFSVHKLSNYSPIVTFKFNNEKVTKLNLKEMSAIKNKLEHEKSVRTIKNIVLWSLIFLIFLLLLFFFIKSYIKSSIKRQKEQEEKEFQKQQEIMKKQEEIDFRHEEFKKQLINKYGVITRVISNNLYDYDGLKNYDEIFVFEKPMKIIFGKKEYDFNDILSCSMYDENHKDIPPAQVTRTNTGSMLGRAAIGGLTLGVAGAVVGAMTAKTESFSNEDFYYIGSYVVKIGLKSIEEPILTLKYGSDKSKAEEVYALMQAIIAMK